ncbi:Helix-turn-helix domain-containing protein [Fibrobacter intestinalis]|uniref:Helix-turn-helix domain-containing protein n=2 Tax=Fibrobacteraceae TaxID=204431 RepID=A0A1T4K8P9_9BACT|nr:helix-turn-helix protein [Fibrobacter sp. NR9]SJZ38820.1 Helix-turn-helix domain-containing protein [Fibrobacter intestinalis]
MTFGDFVREKRLNVGVNLRALAKELGIVPAYMSDIEKNHRYPPEKEKIFKIAEVLKLTEEERNQMFDLAGEARVGTIAPDISDYVTSQSAARVALRKARDLNLGEKEWMLILRDIEKQGQNNK